MRTTRDQDVLFEFLRMPVTGTEEVFERFLALPGAVLRGSQRERFLYVPGWREDRVVLVAHADTAWDGQDANLEPKHGEPFDVEDGIITSSRNGAGLGADDRAGCAVLWLLKDLGHSLLVTDGEESLCRGASFLATAMENADVAGEINGGHGFAVKFDRCNGGDFKCYDVGTPEFRAYIEGVTGYREPDRYSFTDIVFLCRQIPGANLSVGYRQEHTEAENIDLEEWQHTLDMSREWLSRPGLPSFKLVTALEEVADDNYYNGVYEGWP